MNYYFGHDARGRYVQRPDSDDREYVTREQWDFFIAQARVKPPAQGDRVKLAITISGCVEKYEGETLVETVYFEPETTTL